MRKKNGEKQNWREKKLVRKKIGEKKCYFFGEKKIWEKKCYFLVRKKSGEKKNWRETKLERKEIGEKKHSPMVVGN